MRLTPQYRCRCSGRHGGAWSRALFCLAGFLAAAASLAAYTSGRDLASLSIEELMNESVTSVSKKATALDRSPAAIAVVTQDDLQRSGATSLPEALRLVPGLEVAQINPNYWAIGSRGFNNQYSDKLLVLLDGRSIYSPSFAGVFWDAQDPMLQDLERIEVIRGPGATLWGANAVNGVINIISKSAKDTQGALATIAVGTGEQPVAAARYGGRTGANGFYRVYASHSSRGGMVDAAGIETPEHWETTHGGFRVDWMPTPQDTFTLLGDLASMRADEAWREWVLEPPFSRVTRVVSDSRDANILGRWTHAFSDVSEVSVQAYFDHSDHASLGTTEHRDTWDLDLQHRIDVGEHHDVVWGLGFRLDCDDMPPSSNLVWTPQKQRAHVATAFVQDEIALVPDRWSVIVGTKFEHNNYTGLEVQPGLRLLWTPTARQTAWAAVSRAVRTPSRHQVDGRTVLTVFQMPEAPVTEIAFFGDGGLESEELLAYELGYRLQPTARLSFDVATFYNVYDKLVELAPVPAYFEPAPVPHLVVPLVVANVQTAETWGAEISADWMPVDRWRLTASYSWLRMRVHPGGSSEGESPEHQARLHSHLELARDLALETTLSHVGRLAALRTGGAIPAYVQLDLGLVWRPADALELAVWGRNLGDDRHPEFNGVTTALRTEVPRSFMTRVTLRY